MIEQKLDIYDISRAYFKLYKQDKITSQNIYDELNEANNLLKSLTKSSLPLWFPDLSIERIEKLVNTDDKVMPDFECVNGVIQLKKYEPIRLEFVTTGNIVIENDLRDEFKREDEKDPYIDININNLIGRIEYTKFWHKKGLLMGFVGNSSPSIYYSKVEETILIKVEHDEDYNPILPNDSYTLLSRITTDLWWYSICNSEDLGEHDYEVHHITPGTWELEHTYSISDLEGNYPYATLKLKR